MSWNDGYVTEVPYTYGYYPELSPARVNLSLLLAGHAPLPPGPCCELGFGQGVCLAFSAAADPTRPWWGNDFNPAHVQHARSLIAAAGVEAHLSDESFEEFAARRDLPQFAYIALHGIWSWISNENRAHISAFIRRNLAPGGVVYISYNTAAGWAATLPLQQLLSAFASREQPAGVPPPQRMTAALEFAKKVFAAEPAVVAQTPHLRKRLDGLMSQDPVYLTHEYLNSNWHPCSFADVSAAMEGAKLAYAGTAYLLDHVAALQTSEAQRALLRDIGDPLLRQVTKDFVTAQTFRRDLWVRGLPRISSHRQSAAWRATRVVMASTMPSEPIKVRGARGEGTIPERLTGPVLETLAASAAPVGIGELEARIVGENYSAAQYADTMLMLLGSSRIEVARPEAEVEAAGPPTSRLNAHLADRGPEHGSLAYLVSPVSGCGVFVPRITQLLIAGSRAGCTTTEEFVADAMRRLSERGESLSIQGKAFHEAAELQAEIARTVEVYLQMVPALRRLQVM